MKTTTKTTRIKEKVVEYFSLRDNWVEIKRENVMVGQEYNFNQLTSEEVHLQRNMMIMMLLVMIIIIMMIHQVLHRLQNKEKPMQNNFYSPVRVTQNDFRVQHCKV